MIIIDRIEENMAVCETEEGVRALPLAQLPPHVREGDVLENTPDGWQVDPVGTAARREEARRRTRSLFRRRRGNPPKQED